jgi:hypothetical protein
MYSRNYLLRYSTIKKDRRPMQATSWVLGGMCLLGTIFAMIAVNHQMQSNGAEGMLCVSRGW